MQDIAGYLDSWILPSRIFHVVPRFNESLARLACFVYAVILYAVCVCMAIMDHAAWCMVYMMINDQMMMCCLCLCCPHYSLCAVWCAAVCCCV